MPEWGDNHGRHAAQWTINRVAPYFLLFFGSVFLLAGVYTLIAYLTGHMD